MNTLAARPAALDESARGFISTFMSHVATVARYGPDRGTTIAGVKALLIAAIEEADGASETAWSLLHRTITEAVAAASVSRDTRSARAYLQSFLQENADLAAAAATSTTAASSQPATGGFGDPIRDFQIQFVGGIS